MYFIAHGGTISDPGWLYAQGFRGVGYVVQGSAGTGTSIPSTAALKSAGFKDIHINPFNDGVGGLDNPFSDGYWTSWFQAAKNAGYTKAAGEGVMGFTVKNCVSVFPYLDYCGDVGGRQFDPYGVDASGPRGGYPSNTSSYYCAPETYVSGSTPSLASTESVMLSAQNHNAGGVGYLIGSWVPDIAGVSFVNQCTSAGIKVGAVVFWTGLGGDICAFLKGAMNGTFNALKSTFGVSETWGSAVTPVTENACKFVLVHETLCTYCQQQEAILTQMKTDYPQITIVELLDSGSDLTTLQTMYPDTYAKFTSCGLVPVTGIYNSSGAFIQGFCNLQTADTLKTACGSSGGVTPVTPVGTLFTEMSNFNLVPYLTKKHDGQPTPGIHKIIIYPYGAVAINAVASAQVREYQPGNQ